MRFNPVEFLIRFYRLFISPLIHLLIGPGFGCRFTPTCSEYSREAFHKASFYRATLLTIRRICRCNPFGDAGYDPLPHGIEAQTKFQTTSISGR